MCLNKVSAYKALTEIFGHNFSTSTISKVLKTQKMELVPKWIWAKTKGLIHNADDIYVFGHRQPKTQIKNEFLITTQIIQVKRGELINKALIPIGANPSYKPSKTTRKHL